MENIRLQKYIFAILVMLIATSITLYFTLGENVSLEEMRQSIRNFGIWAPLVFIIFYAVITLFIPSTPFMAMAGVLFGFGYGFLYVTIGGFLGAMMTFYISRKLGKNWVEQILQHRYFILIDLYNKRLEKGAIWDLMLIRVAPMPFNVLNILMGISRISSRDYIIGTLLGLIPSNVLTVYFGSFITRFF